ncbi:MAG: hypothetical protein HY691_20420 [Chloroflexi bacterium]|nr:hypothetical protein [Chloroflexota bacterium]
MVGTLSSMIAALTSAGIVGLGDQYMALFLLGLVTRAGWAQPIGPAAFVGETWFLIVVATAWAMTTLPSLLPHSPLATIVNALSGPVSLLSGAIFAWASAGIVASVRPEFAAAMYLLNDDARWFRFDAYQSADTAVLFGGAALAGSLTFAKFVAKPGLALKTGTFGTVAAPMFATVESGLSLVLTPLILFLQQLDPLLVLLLVALLVLGLFTLLFISLRWLLRALRGSLRGIDQAFRLLSERPRAGLSVVGEFLLPGIGWMAMGHPARGAVMLALWTGIATLALTVVGLLIAVPAYLFVARWSATALYREITKDNLAAAPPLHSGERGGDGAVA